MRQRLIGLAVVLLVCFIYLIPPVQALDQWYNYSWHYREKFDFNASGFEKQNWPIELTFNFTQLLESAGSSDLRFDNNSIRVFEYNSSGGIMQEVPHQFDRDPYFNPLNNAVGELVFIMNGTTLSNQLRHYYVYFDSMFYGSKPIKTYSSTISYAWDGEEFNVTNSLFQWFIDTKRGENSSGIYRVQGPTNPNSILLNTSSEIISELERTFEYSKYTNGTSDFGFDFANNATFIAGPIRVTAVLAGDETIWGDRLAKTTSGRLTKKYKFYDSTSWIKIDQTYTNIAASGKDIESSAAAATAFDYGLASYTETQGDSNNPYSWTRASLGGSFGIGFIHLTQNGTQNYSAMIDPDSQRVGINLSLTTIPQSSSISESAIMDFNDTDRALTTLLDTGVGFQNLITTQYGAESGRINFTIRANYSIYNRNETVHLILNITGDPYNFTTSANLTLDNSTIPLTDDFNLTLFDDGNHNDLFAGDKIFANNFTLNSGDIIGLWNISARVHGLDLQLLNTNSSTFNTTNEYVLTSAIQNTFGITDRIVNATIRVMNFRGDFPISAAILACNYPITFSQDYGNGTYRISFNAPSIYGNYSLNCNATKAGNIGFTQSNFSSEAATTNASLQNSPSYIVASGITLLANYNFTLYVNVTNTGFGASNFGNITLQLPGNWTSSNLTFACGNISIGAICASNFSITVANRTMPGNYSINSTYYWLNPDGTSASNTSQTIVNVTSNPVYQIIEQSLTSIVGINRTKRIGNFTIRSIGNDAISNLTFNVTGMPGYTFTFIPSSVTSLAAGLNISIQLNVTIPFGVSSGDYSGLIFINSNNALSQSLELNLTITGANVSIVRSITNFTANNITQTQNQSFPLQINLTNIGNATAYFANITLNLPSGLISSGYSSICSNMSVGGSCSANFEITVLNTTSPGTYLVNATAFWQDLEIGIRSNLTVVNVTVLTNPILQILQTAVSGNATHGNTTTIANFTIMSVGNDLLQNISINLIETANFTVVFSPQNLSSLSAGSSQIVLINATLPYLYEPGEVNYTINVTTGNTPEYELNLTVYITPDRDWQIGPTYCEKTESPDSGVVCEISLNNTGNTFINFSLSTFSANFTSADTGNFTIDKQGSYSFNITYNISGQPKIPYNATYLVMGSLGAPLNRSFVISLVPFQSLVVNLTITPLFVQNNQSVVFDFNVTDSNLVGIKNVTARVVLPNGTITNVNLSKIGSIYNATGNITQWRGSYPNRTFGSTVLAGNYSVSVSAYDNVEVNGTHDSWFYAYPRLTATLQTLSLSYAKGTTASIYSKTMDFGGGALQNANVSIWVRDPLGILVFNQSYVTSISGIIEPLPTFSIPPDAQTGNWTLYSSTIYYDPYAGVTVNGSSNGTFAVVDATSGGNFTFSGLLSNFETGDLFFGGDTVQLGISIYDVNGAPLDPDMMNISIYYPNDTVFSVVNFSQINRSSIGLYYYKFTAPRNATSGVYRAELNVFRGSFFNRNLALFRISSSLFVDVETSFVWYPSSVMTFRILVYSGDGQPLDPSSLNLTVIDPASNTYFAIGVGSMTKQSTGYYLYNHAMGANTSTGNYYAQAQASKDNAYTVKLKPFRVSQGGPYDIRLELLETEVYAGDYLDFRAVMENKGEVTQDVTLEYWVTDGIQTWYYGSEAILTPAYQNTSVLRSAYIFTSQPTGLYRINGRVTYDLIKPPIDVNYTFSVIPRPAATATPTTGPGGASGSLPPSTGGGGIAPTPTPEGGAPPFKDYSGLQIISYPDEVSVQAGEIKYPKIQVKNIGLVALHNLTIALAGVPLPWVEVLPSRINALAPGDIATFVLKITVPATEKTSVKKVRALALSSERKEEVRFDLSIFESKMALIEHQILVLKEKAQKIAKDAKDAEIAGKNVAAVWETLDSAQKYLKDAEDNLRNEQLDDASGNVQIADTFLAKANAELIAAPFNPPSYVQLPNWITLAMGIVGVGMGFIVFFFVRKRKKEKPIDAPRATPSTLEKITEVMEKSDNLSLEREKSKIKRALRLLEDELTDGTISQRAYGELKRRYDNKLITIDRKMR